MRQTFLTFVLILIILGTGFVWLRYVRAPSTGATPTAGQGSERLAQYRHLKTLTPDLGLFSDPLFQSLKRTVSPVAPLTTPAGQPVPTGRTNPFTPFQ